MLEEVAGHSLEWLEMEWVDKPDSKNIFPLRDIFFLYPEDSKISLELMRRTKREQFDMIAGYRKEENDGQARQKTGEFVTLPEAAVKWFERYWEEFKRKHKFLGFSRGLGFVSEEKTSENNFRTFFVMPVSCEIHQEIRQGRREFGVLLSNYLFTHNLLHKYLSMADEFEGVALFEDTDFRYPVRNSEAVDAKLTLAVA